jgi:hypothetical protein
MGPQALRGQLDADPLGGGVLGRPARRGGRPTKARPQLLGHHLHDRSGAADLRGPAPLLESTHDTTRLSLARGCAACSAWSRQTITVKNNASCSRRPDTATWNAAWRCRPRRTRARGAGECPDAQNRSCTSRR